MTLVAKNSLILESKTSYPFQGRLASDIENIQCVIKMSGEKFVVTAQKPQFLKIKKDIVHHYTGQTVLCFNILIDTYL